jgi:hypothetical protein
MASRLNTSTRKMSWFEVTTFVRETAAGMQSGQMLHLEDFSLRASVSFFFF